MNERDCNIMPAATSDYADLLRETLPEVIEDFEQYRAMGQRFGNLVGKQRKRSKEETKLMRLLGLLLQDYDRRHASPREGCSPAELLKFLTEESGQPASALLAPIFGSRSHVSEALNGKRPIGADQARKLGELFHVKPGLFI